LKRGQLSEIYTKKGQPGNTVWSETILRISATYKDRVLGVFICLLIQLNEIVHFIWQTAHLQHTCWCNETL